VVLPDAACGELHGEHVSDGPYPLPRRGFFQIFVAVPARLLRRVGNELENPLGARRDLPGHGDDARSFLLFGHALIQPLNAG
jgi:hypothetical protein